MVGSLLFTACGSAKAEEAAPAEEAAAEEAAPAEEAAAEPEFTCALITPNPLGDRSFIDSSARGIEQANAELPVKCDIIETNGVSEHEAALRGAIAEGYDLVLGLAIDAELFVNLANEFPDQKFSSPSELFVEKLPANLVSYQAEVHESSFLAGIAAGMMTESKILGVVNGGDSPSMNQFTYGFEQGVWEVCPDCQVLVSYLGFEFSNPTLGLETALGQYDQGADIIYQVAGRSGEGVLEAAAQRNLYAIGVDSNQDYIQPGHVITSVIKRVDKCTYDSIASVVNGTFEGGRFISNGLAEGFSGLSWDEGSTAFEENGPAEMVAKLPEVKAKVEEYRAKILSGEYKVCDSLVPDTAECQAVLAH
ncbi:MAG: BMP family ABC transporter substrate-binding protein [Anaerolineae bacterium]|nr:BMP family ABC transporter substrate-binding protein [Anaerolineae bacterium]